MIDLLVLHGPNLNMLGTREPEIYGSDSLADIDRAVQARAASLSLSTDCFQSNDEGALISTIQDACATARSIVINAAAYTHTSVALRDALAMFEGPKVEVHLSKNFKREAFRQISLISPVCDGSIVGFGMNSYLLGVAAVHGLLAERSGRVA